MLLVSSHQEKQKSEINNQQKASYRDKYGKVTGSLGGKRFIDGVLGMFTDDFEMKMLHLNQTLNGPAAHDYLKEMVLDEDTVSSDFRIIYENDACAVTYERMAGALSGHVSIVQLWRDNKIYYMEVSVIEDRK